MFGYLFLFETVSLKVLKLPVSIVGALQNDEEKATDDKDGLDSHVSVLVTGFKLGRFQGVEWLLMVCFFSHSRYLSHPFLPLLPLICLV